MFNLNECLSHHYERSMIIIINSNIPILLYSLFNIYVCARIKNNNDYLKANNLFDFNF